MPIATSKPPRNLMYGTTLLYETDADDGQPIGLFLRGDPSG